MSAARQEHTATPLQDGHVLIAGGRQPGRDGVRTGIATAELYDPVSGQFNPTGSMSAGRSNQTATLLVDGRVLVAGGLAGSAGLATAELYDPGTGKFAPTGSMNVSRSEQTATALPDGTVLVAGGASTGLASAERYQP